MRMPSTSYEALYEGFAWDIPDQYNMAWDVCDKWADSDPDKLAIIEIEGTKRRDFTFGQLQEKADKLALYLRDNDVKPGNRVAVFLSQGIWCAAAHIAIWKLGAISVPLFHLFEKDALAVRMSDAGVSAVITDKTGAAKVSKTGTKATIIQPANINFPILNQTITPYNSSSEDPALLIYTSGTTGAPKGALHAHRVLLGHLPGVFMSHDFMPQDDDCFWTPADWAWIGGLLDVLMPGLQCGIPVVASRMNKFTSQDCIKIIRQASVKNIFFPPTALRKLKSENAVIKGLRSVACGGEPLGEEMLNWGKKALGVTINEFYGQTECNMIVSSAHSLFDPMPGFMGKPVPGHKVSVIDAAGNPTMEEGDIAVKRGSASMMLEYWKNPAATREKFRNDWLITGDRGQLKDGYIRFIAREDDVINSSGYRIGPSEIEDCLLAHPVVASVGVVGKPDQMRNEIIKAYIIPRPEALANGETINELQDFVKTRLAAHEYPREIEFVPELPMTISGKIIRKALKQRAIEETEND